MNILRDSKHESWVLAAYPDPKTGRPLIGAGFNLDVSATQHIQTNPLNPHLFVEPSTAELWQDAGLDLARLQSILDQFDRDMSDLEEEELSQKDQNSSTDSGNNRARSHEFAAHLDSRGHPQCKSLLR